MKNAPILSDEGIAAWIRATATPVEGEDQSLPLYRQMAQRLAGYIRGASVAPGTPLPPLAFLATESGVSLRTMDKAVNELIADGLCLRKPKKGTLVAGVSARPSGKEDKRKAFILYTPSGRKGYDHNQLIIRITSGIHEALKEERIDFLTAFYHIEEAITFYQDDSRLSVQGVAVNGPLDRERLVALAHAFPRIPFVMLNHCPPDFTTTPANVYGIFNDDYAGAYQMTSWMIARGRRRIAIFLYELSPNDNVYAERLAGYRQAMANHGFEVRPEWIHWGRKSRHTIDDCGPELTRNLFALDPEADAIFTVCDQMLPGVRKWLRQEGLAERVLLGGYDFLFPQLSMKEGVATIAVPYAEMGSQVVRFCAGSLLGMPKIHRLQPQFIPPPVDTIGQA